MRQLRAGLALIAAVLFAVAGVALPLTASAHPAARGVPMADPTAAAPKKLFNVQDPRLQDASGLAKSVKHKDTYWAVSSSGAGARVFAINSDGKVRAVLRFNAAVKDVEAVGVGRDGTIYVADIGDNQASRDMIEIYTIPEPEVLQDETNVKYHRFDFTYPDGPHDAETLLVEPGTNQLYIVTKKTKGTGTIYAAPPAPSRQGTNELSELGPAPAGVVTDGTFLPGGSGVVLRTDTDIATVAWGDNPSVVARAALPIGKGQTVAMGPTDNTVMVGNDGANAAVYLVSIPIKKSASTPGASATPKGASSADSGSSSGKSHNLMWVIIGAAVFALVITIITFPPGRRERRDRMAENARLTGQSPTNRRRHHV